MSESNAQALEKDGPRYRRHAPKLPAGATFTATHLVVQNDDGKWMNRRLVAVNRDRRQKKALGLSGRQLKKLRRAEKRANTAASE
jgi:hypothetical protein